MASIHNAKATGFQGPQSKNILPYLVNTSLQTKPHQNKKNVAPTFTPGATKLITTLTKATHQTTVRFHLGKSPTVRNERLNMERTLENPRPAIDLEGPSSAQAQPLHHSERQEAHSCGVRVTAKLGCK